MMTAALTSRAGNSGLEFLVREGEPSLPTP